LPTHIVLLLILFIVSAHTPSRATIRTFPQGRHLGNQEI
jgi:hypothetical protein